MDKPIAIVTGGAGFIGSELVRELSSYDMRVLIVDNLVNGSLENINDVINDNVSITLDKIEDFKFLDNLL